MAFIMTTRGGFVNLDHVAKAVRSGADKGILDLLDLNGEKIASVLDNVDFEAMTAPTVPASPGEIALVLTIWDDDYEGDSPVLVNEVPVIAWRCTREYPSPVLVTEPCGNERVLVSLGGGRWAEQYVAEYESRDEAIKQITEETFRARARARARARDSS